MPLNTLPMQDFHIPRGDYYEATIDTDSEDPGNPGTLAGITIIEWEAATFDFLSPNPADVILTKTLAGGGITVVSASDMIVKVIFQGVDTSGLPANAIYYWQLSITTAGGNKTTLSRGRLFIDQTI